MRAAGITVLSKAMVFFIKQQTNMTGYPQVAINRRLSA